MIKLNNASKNWPELTAILLARLGFLWLLVFVSLLIPKDDVAFYAFLGFAFIITIPYSLWLRSKLRVSEFAPLQFVVDLVLVTGVVYFTGGIHSNLTLLYPLVILSAGIVGTPRQATEITVLAIVTYALMATLLSNRMLVEYIPTDNAFHLGTAHSALLIRSLTFALFGAVSIYISKACNYIATQETELSETTAALLRNIPSPALLLDESGRIVSANQEICSLLDESGENLCSMDYTSLCAEGMPPLPGSYGKTVHLYGKGGMIVPAAYSSKDFEILENALYPAKGHKHRVCKVTLLTFTDLSHALETGKQLEKVKQIHSATRIAGEMAQEIRSPLTTLSASVQMLQSYEQDATVVDWLPNSPRRKDRNELFGHIEDASRSMDALVKNFIDFAEYIPADLISIIKLDSIIKNEG
ncbi:MAG: hypothetical protein HKP10_02475 [Kiritimatiellales bacterium]|nr:hypothetical protein [Kiritimatiellales bacterium]